MRRCHNIITFYGLYHHVCDLYGAYDARTGHHHCHYLLHFQDGHPPHGYDDRDHDLDHGHDRDRDHDHDRDHDRDRDCDRDRILTQEYHLSHGRCTRR